MGAMLSRKKKIIVVILLCVGHVLIYREVLMPRPFSLHVLAAGKGTALLVEPPGGGILLIDTGTDAEIVRSLGRELPPWVRHIDVLILTNDSPSARGGLPFVREAYTIGTELHIPPRGTRIDLGKGIFAESLWPPKTRTPLPYGNTSLIRISGPHSTYLFEGKIPVRVNTFLSSLGEYTHLTERISSSTHAGTEYVEE